MPRTWSQFSPPADRFARVECSAADHDGAGAAGPDRSTGLSGEKFGVKARPRARPRLQLKTVLIARGVMAFLIRRTVPSTGNRRSYISMGKKFRTHENGAARPRVRSALIKGRVAVVLVGVALPYAARLPGVLLKGPDWLTSYFPGEIGVLLLFGFNAIVWCAILAGTLAFRSVPAVLISAAIGFALPFYFHATLDLRADAQASVALIGLPILSLPLVGLGWLLGYLVDRRQWNGRAA